MRIPKEWNKTSYKKFQDELHSLEDIKYKEFNFKIIFTNYKEIGIRMPILRDIAKKISNGDFRSFLGIVECLYYEEVMIEGLVITNIKDLDIALFYFEKYIEKIDNWALCDYVIANMKIIKKHKKIFFKKIKKYVKSKNEYIVRVGLVMLLNYYIDEEHIDTIFKICNNIKKDTYYVNMAISWLISECFVKEKKETIEFLKCNRLNDFTQNKAISKIRDSLRVSALDKMYVLDFKR